MKTISKLLAVVLMLVLVLPCISGTATTRTTEDGNVLENLVAMYPQCVIRRPAVNESAPYLSELNSLLTIAERTAVLSEQDEEFLADNGFWYRQGEPVQTKGRENVATYWATTDFDDSGKNLVIEWTEENFPNVVILRDPTSWYNCHSYAWYSNSVYNHCWINDVETYISDVHTLLVENQDDYMVGDILVYIGASNEPAHSAVITEIDGDQIICQSKWGSYALCEHDARDVPADYLKADGSLACVAFRITGHTYTYESNESNTHTATCSTCTYEETQSCSITYSKTTAGNHAATCTKCGDTTTEACELDYTCVNTYYHKGTCADCGYTESTESCQATYSYVGNGSGQHTATCSVCEGSITRQCNKECIWYSGSQHRAECADCGVVSYESCSSGVVYTGNGTTHTHALGCDECGHTTTTTTACTFSAHYAYAVNGVNYHRNVCDGCGYTKATLVQCIYKNSNNCFLCGAPKDAGTVVSIQDPSTAE